MSDDFKIYGVAGRPILYSKSPDLYNPLLEKLNFNGRYLRIAGHNFKDILNLIRILDIEGVNFTAPFKQQALDSLELSGEISEIVEEIKTTNIWYKKTNKSYKDNTDLYGVNRFLENLPLKKKRIACLGAGSTAELIYFYLKKNNIDFDIFNRTQTKSEEYKSLYNKEIKNLQEFMQDILDYDIIILLIPFYASCNLFRKIRLNPNQIIYDVAYNSKFFIQKSKKENFQYIDGSNWLIGQTQRNSKLFFDIDVSSQELFNNYQKYKNKKNLPIVLTGYMGAGKTLIGQNLAKRMRRRFYDTDQVIEKRINMSVAEFFEKHTEAEFRELEQKVLKSIINIKDSVISTGGGIVENHSLLNLIKERSINFWLIADPDECFYRINLQKRPLIKDKDISYYKALFNKRKKLYAKAADVIMLTSNKSITQSVLKIIEEIASL